MSVDAGSGLGRIGNPSYKGVGGGQKLSHYRGQIEPPSSLPSELFGSQLFDGSCPWSSHGIITCAYAHYGM
jgi:hypothetical protein